ncbi:MAG: drug/metabolite transporter (DMT)-like permease [Paracoccaceae bacterium]|jgi:drug/metabolite transporter (DMT)-like permease
MYNLALYLLTIAIWGSTWILAKYQVDEVSALQSVFFRYFIAALLLQGLISALRSRNRHSLRTHGLFFLLGSFLFCWNYVLFYTATGLGLTTGLIAVIFSLIITMNIANNALLFREMPERKTVIGAAVGLTGLVFVFAEDISALHGQGLLPAIVICIIATYLASLGNMMSKILQRQGVSVTGSNGWGMTYGALTLLIVVLLFDDPIRVPITFPFLSSLFFLVVFGSIIAFWSYLTLLGRVGADKAAYAMIVFPIWALMISWMYEGFLWTPFKVFGVAVILVGNLFIVGRKRQID